MLTARLGSENNNLSQVRPKAGFHLSVDAAGVKLRMGRCRRRSDSYQFFARLDEALGGFSKFEPKQGTAGGEHQINPGGDERLMLPVDFAQPALGTIAMHGIAHGGS